MLMMAGGREIEVPTNAEGKVDVVEARRIAGVPDDRALILQKPTGENFIVPKRGCVDVGPYDHFMESARAVRGQ